LLLLKTFVALNGLLCADMPLRSYWLTAKRVISCCECCVDLVCWWKDWTTWRVICSAMVQVSACYVEKSSACLVPPHLSVKSAQR